MAYTRVPQLRDSTITIRQTRTRDEVEAANWLVYRNYVAAGFWKPDLAAFHANSYLRSPHRTIFVVTQAARVLGTASIIKDSEQGLPSDAFQPEILRCFRKSNEVLGEISCLAMEKTAGQPRNLILFLIKYYLQYAYYYTDIERLIKACKPEHAEFYANVIRFQKLGQIVHCKYAQRPSQLLSMNLIEGHQQLKDHYEWDGQPRNNLYRFLLCDTHASLIFPKAKKMRRSRLGEWSAHANSERPILQFSPASITRSIPAHA